MPRVTPERDDVWKKGGNMQKTMYCVQELVAKFASKYIFGVHLQDSTNGSVSTEHTNVQEKKENHYQISKNGGKKRSSWDTKQITVPQFKQMLSGLFTVRGSPFKQKGLTSQCPLDDPDSQRRKEEEEWDIDQVMLDLGDTREDCREAFAAVCYLLLDCTTFPVYLSTEETEQLYFSLFQVPGKMNLFFKCLVSEFSGTCSHRRMYYKSVLQIRDNMLGCKLIKVVIGHIEQIKDTQILLETVQYAGMGCLGEG